MSVPAIATRSPRASALRSLQARLARVLTTLPDWALMTWMAVTVGALNVDLAFGIQAPTVFLDEAVYANLAHGIADHHLRGVLEAAQSGYGFVYPTILAPAFALGSAPTGYAAAKLVNAVLLASSVVPIFLLARRALPRPWAVAATMAATIGPQTNFAGLVMTENASFPLFIWSMLGVVRMLEHPTRKNQVVALASVVVCIATRTQAVVFFPGLSLAIGAAVFFEPQDRRRRLRQFATTWVGLVLAGAAAIGYVATKGTSAAGAYAIVLSHGYSPVGTARWAAANLADLDLLLGFGMFAIAPFALSRALRGPSGSVSSRALAAVLVGFGLPSLFLVAAFSSSAQGGHREHERYLIYFVPLLIVLCLRWIRDEASAARGVTLLSAVAAAVLPIALPLEHMRTAAWIDSFGAEPWLNDVLPIHQLRLICVGVAMMVLTGVVLSSPRVRTSLILTTFIAAGFLSFTSVRAQAQHWGRYGVSNVDWIDEAVGGDAHVDGIYVFRPCRTIFQRQAPIIQVWRSAFFNRSLALTYYVGARGPNLQSQKLTVHGDHAFAHGSPVSPRYVLVPAAVDVAGTVLAREGNMTLVKASAPLRIRLPHWANPESCPSHS